MKNVLKPFLILTIISSLVFVSACKKNSATNGLVASTNEVYTVNGNAQTTMVQYTYDGQGRQTQAVTTGASNSTVTYNYNTPGKVIKTNGSNTTTYTLNSQGLAYFDGISVFTYTNGYMTRQTDSFSVDSFVVNTIVNGNITNIEFSLNGTLINFGYQYTTMADYRSYGLSFLGKTSADNILQETTASSVINYTYQYDNKGRVSQQSSSLSGGTTTDVITYTYVYN